MVRCQATGKDGRPVFVFGLTRENITRLTNGEPIKLDLDAFGLTGPPLTIYLTFGETEEAIARELSEFIGPQTQVQDRRRHDQ